MMKKVQIREPVNALTHTFAALTAVPATFYLVFTALRNGTNWIGMLIYGLSLIFMFSASGIYHLFDVKATLLVKLRKLDHSAIYLLIAGTYTPICLTYFEGFWQWGLLSIIWLMAVSGVIVKVFVIKAPRLVTAGIYLVMGWISILAIGEMLRTMPAGSLIWLVTGGILYSIGAVIYITKKLDFYPGVFGFHEVWHIFVILAAISHYVVMAFYVVRA